MYAVLNIEKTPSTMVKSFKENQRTMFRMSDMNVVNCVK